MSDNLLPTGEPVPLDGSGSAPRKGDYEGRHVTLTPITSGHVEELYRCSHGSSGVEQLWTYMGYGPFDDQSAMYEWLEGLAPSTDPLFFAVLAGSGCPIGMVSFLNIVPDMRRLELGHIWYSPDAQRTRANTEAAYLMLCETFDVLGYRRAEWKCDALNERSKAAAKRLGFHAEGVFRQHLVVKDRNRDTAWFSMLDSEWTDVKRDLEAWLYEGNEPAFSLTERNSTST